MIFRQPDCFFLVAGAADGETALNAFDKALLDAGVGDTNLVRLSSILPPFCDHVDPLPLPPGALVPVAYASMTSSKIGGTITAAVAVAIPEDPTQPGLIMEYHGEGDPSAVEEKVRGMVLSGMKLRDRPYKKILSIKATSQVQWNNAVFAGVVLWAKL
jgi:arginine decarboxylase